MTLTPEEQTHLMYLRLRDAARGHDEAWFLDAVDFYDHHDPDIAKPRPTYHERRICPVGEDGCPLCLEERTGSAWLQIEEDRREAGLE